jgi:MFS family permease
LAPSGPVAGNRAALRERGSFELLSETMSIYFRHPRQFMILSGVMMAPVAVFSLLLGLESRWAHALSALALSVALTAVVGAGVVAVGQHYLRRRVDVREAYGRVGQRAASVVAVAISLGVVMALGVPLIVILVPFALALVYAVSWSFGSSVAIVEKQQLVEAFKRSRKLVSGSWWRVFGILVALWLVAIGVGLLVVLVPSVVSRGVFGDASSSAIFVGWIAGLVAAMVAPPVISIGYALLYFDLRHRREDFGFDVMEKELALAPVGGAFELTRSGPTGAGPEAGQQEGGS